MKIGTIKIGRNTKHHRDHLVAFGYAVEEVLGEAPRYEVEVSGFVDALDMGHGESAILDLVSRKAAMTYKTRVKFADGKVLSGVPACLRLGPKYSSLVMTPKAPEKAETDVVPPVIDLFAEVLKLTNEVEGLRAEIARLRTRV